MDGKLDAIDYAIENEIPIFGICLGMQIAVIEFARSVLGYADANSREFDEICEHPVIDLMKDQEGVIMGGTMRLGKYPCKVLNDTILHAAYKADLIEERHRHRYEFNNDYRQILESHGLVLSGINPKRDLVEVIEIKNHPYFIACQYHLYIHRV